MYFQAPHMDLQKPPDDYFTQYDAASSPYQVERGGVRVDAGTPVQSPIIDNKVILSASRSHACLGVPKLETCELFPIYQLSSAETAILVLCLLRLYVQWLIVNQYNTLQEHLVPDNKAKYRAAAVTAINSNYYSAVLILWQKCTGDRHRRGRWQDCAGAQGAGAL